MLESELVSEDAPPPGVAEIFDDIRATNGRQRIDHFWRALAHDRQMLETTWSRMKGLMMEPSADGLDPMAKQLIYLAAAIANGCIYCVHSETASARRMGMTDAQYDDLVAVVALASQTSALASELDVPIDPEYRDAAG
ncbi:MAG: carboxymuconolactone decarboxylase family protein [Pseudomonadota bacterium]